MSELLPGTFRMLAGIGVFLLGMTFLEESLRLLAGRRFKLYLRDQSSSKLKGVVGGAVVTAMLQSSSVVNLMVLALVGSNVLRLEHALAVILGSNIGTTLDSWIVATLGFRFSIESFAFPLLGISGILRALWVKGTNRHTWSVFFFGLGAVFAGLEFMKTGFLGLAGNFDFSSLQDYPLFLFLFSGFLITALIQSSYAMMAITLSALHADALTILPATAVILGAELGTTIKLVVAAMDGAGVKRQVAFGNFIYNLLIITVAFLLLPQINHLILSVGITHPMIQLVSFQSAINLTGALLVLPFLHPAARWLEKKFPGGKCYTAFIQNVPEGAGDLGLEAFEKECRRFIFLTLDYFRHSFHSRRSSVSESTETFTRLTIQDQYNYLKALHGEMHSWYIRQRRLFHDEISADLAEQLISAVRNVMFAAKSIHDSAADIQQLRNSSKDEKYLLYDSSRKEVTEFCQKAEVLIEESKLNVFEDLVSFYEKIKKDYSTQVAHLYADGVQLKLNETEISTLINFSRERFSGYKSLIWAIKDLLLDKKQASYFSELPGFIR